MCTDAVEENGLWVQGSLSGAGTSKLSLLGEEGVKGILGKFWVDLFCRLLSAYYVPGAEKPTKAWEAKTSKAASNLISVDNCILGSDRR